MECDGSILHFQCKRYYAIFLSNADFFLPTDLTMQYFLTWRPLKYFPHRRQEPIDDTVETLYNTINFCSSTHKRHSIARPKGRGMGCLL